MNKLNAIIADNLQALIKKFNALNSGVEESKIIKREDIIKIFSSDGNYYLVYYK